MQFIVEGASTESGEEQRIEIYAPNAAAAERLARSRGIVGVGTWMLVPLGLGQIIGGIFLLGAGVTMRLLAATAIAVRDIARNSFEP